MKNNCQYSVPDGINGYNCIGGQLNGRNVSKGVCEACLAGNVRPPRELTEEEKVRLKMALVLTPEQIEDFLARLTASPDIRPIELASTWLKEKGITDARPIELVAQLQQNPRFVSLVMPRMFDRMVSNLLSLPGLTPVMVDDVIAASEDALVRLQAKKSEMLIAGL